MKTKLLLVLFFILVSGSVAFSNSNFVYLVTIDGAIGPVTSRIITDAIQTSVRDGAEALVIELNTPGGLDESMRIITRGILNAGVPVIVYVAPSGSRAASAGVFITLSAHIAAMSPGTNIGAAHPVSMGSQVDSTMLGKVENDAAAYIRSIAQRRRRNAEWAEDAVRKSVSITEKEALDLKVIDLIAENVDDLLAKCDGRTVDLPSGGRVLHTKDAAKRNININWRDRILQVITDPNIAYILFSLGMLGIFFELSNPGAVFPGILGGICLILAFFAFQTLPINYAGVLLMILGVILFLLEIKIVSHGALTIGGIISMLLGSLLLFQSPIPYMRVSLVIILCVVGATALFFIFAVGSGLKAQMRKATTGAKGLVGQVAVARTDLNPEGTVFIHGELWRAESDTPVKTGEKTVVKEVENLTLKVTKKQ